MRISYIFNLLANLCLVSASVAADNHLIYQPELGSPYQGEVKLDGWDGWQELSGESKVIGGSSKFFDGEDWIVMNGWASRIFEKSILPQVFSDDFALEVAFRSSPGRRAFIVLGKGGDGDKALRGNEAGLMFGFVEGGRAMLKGMGGDSLRNTVAYPIAYPTNELVELRLEVRNVSQGGIGTLKIRPWNSAEHWTVIEGLESVQLGLDPSEIGGNPLAWDTLIVAGHRNGGFRVIKSLDVDEVSDNLETLTDESAAYQKIKLIETEPDQPVLIAMPEESFELKFEALVPEAVDSLPDFGTAQIWFSTDYVSPLQQNAYSIRGGRLQDAVAFSLDQSTWTGPVPGDWLSDQNSAFSFDFARLPNRDDKPVSTGEWLEVSLKVGQSYINLLVNDKLALSLERNEYEDGRIALGGSWQKGTYRNIEIKPLDKEPVDEFAPREQYNNPLVQLDFGPGNMTVADGWERVSTEDGRWKLKPSGERNRGGADQRVGTIVFWGHEVREGELALDLEPADYVMSIGVGDPRYPGRLKIKSPDGKVFPLRVARGDEYELRFPFSHKGGEAIVSFDGRESAGGAISYLVVERASDSQDLKFVSGTSLPSAANRGNAAGGKNRDVKPVVIPELSGDNLAKTLDLGGDWLFLPGYAVGDLRPEIPDVSDENWHVLPVPGFWNPVGWWIFGQGNRLVSLAYLYEELDRVEDYTFDWRNTRDAWYRKYIDVPESWKSQRAILEFEGVATICDVYINGEYVGGNTGMFKPFELDIGKHLVPGKENLLAVHVANGEPWADEESDAEEEAEIAVTVRVTREMATELPRGIYSRPSGEDGNLLVERQGGIWLPVKLRLSGELSFENVSPVAGRDDLEISLKTNGSGSRDAKLGLRLTNQAGDIVWDEEVDWKPALGDSSYSRSVSGLEVKSWSPESPELYRFEAILYDDGTIVDRRDFMLGFRSFEIRDGEFYLNGKPWRFIGANMPPHGLHPNDENLAKKFTDLMKEGNQRSIRTVCSPYPELWLDESDRQGIAVSQEGTWPWVLLGRQPIPDEASLKAWKEEWLALVEAQKHRPSILMWTINNENYPTMDPDLERRQEKWKIWQDIMEATRKADPTRPIVVWSGYTRKAMSVGWRSLVGGIDDGDIDDRHTYAGTYTASSMGWSQYWPNFLRDNKTPNRPLISQEAATAYANTDLGYQELSYLKTWHGQTWTGDESYPWNSPRFFLDRTARTTKEQMELARRQGDVEGWLAFCNATWYANVEDASRILPFPTHDAARLALQPILVALDKPPHRVSADKNSLPLSLYVVNDGENEIYGEVKASVRLVDDKGEVLSHVDDISLVSPALGGGIVEKDIALNLDLSQIDKRVPARLLVELKGLGGERLSENSYQIDIFAKIDRLNGTTLALADPSDQTSGEIFEDLKEICALEEKSLADQGNFITISPDEEAWKSIMDASRNGASILVIDPTVLPDADLFTGVLIKEDCLGEVANIMIDGKLRGLSTGLEQADLAWWPMAGPDRFVYHRALTFEKPLPDHVVALVNHSPTHGYDTKWRMNFPVVEFAHGRGSLIIATVNTYAIKHDPAAKQLWVNLLSYLAKQ